MCLFCPTITNLFIEINWRLLSFLKKNSYTQKEMGHLLEPLFKTQLKSRIRDTRG